MAGLVKAADCHNALQLICPDFPLGPIKNAWNTALSIYSDQAETSGERLLRRQAGSLPFNTFLDCFTITFTYERFLLQLRKRFFDANKCCNDLVNLKEVNCTEDDWAANSGWPAPPANVHVDAVTQASHHGKQSSFEFRKLVKILCCHSQLLKVVEEENEAMLPSARVLEQGNSTHDGQTETKQANKEVQDDTSGKWHPLKRKSVRMKS